MPKIGPLPNRPVTPVASSRRDILDPYYETENCNVWCGDNLDIMKGLPGQSVSLAFCDPPFNNGYKYDVYNDKRTASQYLFELEERMTVLRNLMRPDGSLFFAIGAQYQAEVKLLLDEIGYHWRNTIIWHYTFGPRQQAKFTPSWVAIHYYTISKIYTWNSSSIKVASSRQLKYNDRRAQAGGKVPNDVWMLLPEDHPEQFSHDQDFMLESRVCGTFKERTGHPCQMPESVLERIIKVASNPDDIVLDPYLGSGTTAAVALKNKRRAWGIELSLAYCDDYVIPRLKELK